MTHSKEQARYDELRQSRPDLFVVRDENCYPIRSGGEVIAENAHFLLLDDQVLSPDGKQSSYLRVVSPTDGSPGAAILPIADGMIVLLDHPRHAIGQRALEVPRGFGEQGETAENCARRELEEELGVSAEQLVPLGGLHPDTGLLAAEVALFAATVPSAGWKTESGVEVQLMSVADTEKAICEGSISDSFTIACVYRARLRGII